MSAELSLLSLFFLVLLKAALLTLLGPAIALAVLAEKFRVLEIGFEEIGAGADRPQHSGSGHVLGSNPRFVPEFLSASSKVPGDGQLAPLNATFDTSEAQASWATSPSPEIRERGAA